MEKVVGRNVAEDNLAKDGQGKRRGAPQAEEKDEASMAP